MAQPVMKLKVLLPFRIFTEREDVRRIVAETPRGAFGLLPHRLDCVAPLAPGILTFETASGVESFIAVDAGVLVKAGSEVLVSVRNAIGGMDLGELHEVRIRVLRDDVLQLALLDTEVEESL